jgi:hypothetical protein
MRLALKVGKNDAHTHEWRFVGGFYQLPLLAKPRELI